MLYRQFKIFKSVIFNKLCIFNLLRFRSIMMPFNLAINKLIVSG